MADAIQALRRANPRASERFEGSLAGAVAAVEARLAGSATPMPSGARGGRGRRILPASVGGAALATAAVVATLLTLDPFAHGPGVENAAAAMGKAVTATAASAEQSGIAIVRVTRNAEVWAGRTIRWHGGDLSVSSDDPARLGRAGSQLLLVGGMTYGIEDGSWVELGPPESVDPDSGTTPAEYLAAVREDVGGETLRRITGAISGLTTRRLDDGSTVYSGSIAAGVVARETGFKDGQPIRVLPFGYVAHDEAADPAALLELALTLASDGVVREIRLDWGTSAAAWTYTVSYTGLGATPAPAAPADARPLRDRLRAAS